MVDRSKFKHSTQVVVRNNEIDWQEIVHNSVYLNYFEVGRMGYFDLLGFPIVTGSPETEPRVVIARNEIDYRSAARFNETLNVYTRIAWIRNSSYAVEGFIEEAQSKRLIAENVSFHVWLEKETGKPISVPDAFRMKVVQLEGDDVTIQRLSANDNEEIK